MAERTLYHFRMSPFSRRARLALAHKGLLAETTLRDARAEPANMDQVKRVSATETVPVLVDGGRVVTDSTALLHYLDRAYPEAPRLFAEDLDTYARELEIVTLVDAVLNPVVDLGSRYHWLATSMHWAETVSERKDRIFAATARLVRAASSLRGWGAAEISLFTMVLWFEGLPARVGQTPAIERILELGVTMPPELVTWAEPHHARDDVRAL